MERGSDRLALITGRIQTLPSSSSSSGPQSHHEDTPNPSSPPPNSDVQEDPHPHLSEQIAGTLLTSFVLSVQSSYLSVILVNGVVDLQNYLLRLRKRSLIPHCQEANLTQTLKP